MLFIGAFILCILIYIYIYIALLHWYIESSRSAFDTGLLMGLLIGLLTGA